MMGLSRSVAAYRLRPDRNEHLREELRTLAEKKPKYGLPMLFALLQRKGWKVNHKRVERLYRLEKLALRRKKRAKRIVREREKLPVPTSPNEHWAMDFIHDTLWSGRKFRCLTLIDLASRYAPALEVGFSLPSQRVINVLNHLAVTRGLPSTITVDNGPEFICKALRKWAFEHAVHLHFIQPGKPTQNAFIESLNGTFRHECLDSYAFRTIKEARERIEQWRCEYNSERPHSSLGMRTPEEIEINFFKKEEEKRKTGTN
jgi:putative transposase